MTRGGNKDKKTKKLSTFQKNDVKALVASGTKKALQKIAKKQKPDESAKTILTFEQLLPRACYAIRCDVFRGLLVDLIMESV